jgi:adenylyl cyclase-associated protein
VEYIQAYYRIFNSLITYLQQNYPFGLTWNKDGIDAMSALKQIRSGPGAAVNGASAPPPPPLPTFDLGGGPPPPPPPPPGALTGAKPAPSSGGDMSAVFEQLNQGSAVTSTLRKVDKSEMTHKNPNLRATSVVPDRSDSQTSTTSSTRGKSPLPSKKPKPSSMRTKKPPRKELDGNKWYIEHYENASEVIEIPAQLTHSILISRCNKAIIKVNNKANAISIDNCTNLSIIVDSLVSSVEVIKSPKFALQIDGVVPTVMLDQVDGGMIYLNQNSLDTDILTSKCSGMNIVLPAKEGSDDDDKECPLPEQFRSYVKNGSLVHEIVEHAG